MNGYATAAAIIAAVFFAAAFVCVMPGSDADVTYSVEGMVQDSGGNGIEGVRVTISSHPDTTAADGSFKIMGLESVADLTATFYIQGMAVTNVPTMFTDNKDGTYDLNLSDLPHDADNNYDITATPIAMTKISFTAYLMELNSDGNTPLAGTKLNLSADTLTSDVLSTVTGVDGKFTFTPCSLYNLTLSIDPEDKKGYSILSDLLYFGTSTQDGSLVFSIKGVNTSLGINNYEFQSTVVDGVRSYTLPESFPILVAGSTGTVSFKVYDSNGNTLQGATVTLTSVDSSDKYIEESKENGVATFTNVVIGDYEVEIKVGGFEEYESTTHVTKGLNDGKNVEMSVKEEQDFFGMNFSHFMMIIGVVIGVILVVVSYLMFSGHLKPRLEEE